MHNSWLKQGCATPPARNGGEGCCKCSLCQKFYRITSKHFDRALLAKVGQTLSNEYQSFPRELQ
jgi:hypothetical protein